MPHKFTGKEQDPETGLYYYGYRYRDARVITWLSADPALASYLPTGNKDRDSKLPGMGGVFRAVNLDLYHYAGNNPLIYLDPDGREDTISAKNPRATYDKFDSSVLSYKEGTFKSPMFTLLKAYAKIKGFLGGSLTKDDVVDFLGNPDQTFDNFSSLPNDPQTQGTIASGKMYRYKTRNFTSSTGKEIKAFLIYDSELGGKKTPQDPNFNNGANPATGVDYVDGGHMHAARFLPGVNPDTKPNYDSGSRGCVTRYGGFNSEFYPYLNTPGKNMGNFIIFR